MNKIDQPVYHHALPLPIPYWNLPDTSSHFSPCEETSRYSPFSCETTRETVKSAKRSADFYVLLSSCISEQQKSALLRGRIFSYLKIIRNCEHRCQSHSVPVTSPKSRPLVSFVFLKSTMSVTRNPGTSIHRLTRPTAVLPKIEFSGKPSAYSRP